eukprot:1160364-Pelagomonas_calceolata.AAC.5
MMMVPSVTGADEHGVLLMRDYVDCILAAATAAAGSPATDRTPDMSGEQLQGHSEPSCCSSHAREQQQEEQQEQQQRRHAAAVQQQQQHAVARNFCVHVITRHAEVCISKAQVRNFCVSVITRHAEVCISKAQVRDLCVRVITRHAEVSVSKVQERQLSREGGVCGGGNNEQLTITSVLCLGGQQERRDKLGR